jgi:hypothetical protein
VGQAGKQANQPLNLSYSVQYGTCLSCHLEPIIIYEVGVFSCSGMDDIHNGPSAERRMMIVLAQLNTRFMILRHIIYIP